ncbi:hypothetical protein [Corynebacterium pacaense]|uniref:hypothetical protein n=1 Tax=Corynebacterium pacaense TaxID=1816684 RepID=UPI0009BAC8D3|nr:hypothetical protein [Corynebacterium pacaense]
MFPTPATGGDDLNRRQRPTAEGDGLPTSLKAAFWLLLGTSVLLVLSGLVLLTSGYTGDDSASAEYREQVINNQKFIGGINAFAGIVVAALTSQVPRGGKNVRRLLLAIIVLLLLVNLLAFVVRMGGFALAVIGVLLALGALLLYRPAASDHIERNHMARSSTRNS